MYDIFYVTQQETTTREIDRIKSKIPFIKVVNDIYEAKEKCLTSYYWVVWDDIILNDDFNFNFDVTQMLPDVVIAFLNGESYDGVFLIPSNMTLSKREVEYRFFVNKHETQIEASKPKPYDSFLINSYEDYLAAIEKTTTNLFWMRSNDTDVSNEFTESFYIPHHNSYSRSQSHMFYNKAYDTENCLNIFLVNKFNKITKEEIDLRQLYEFEINDVHVVGKLQYDVFTIDSYDEYVTAIANSKTEMFWGTSKNIDTTEFDFSVYFSYNNLYDRHENHAFIHKVNGTNLYNGLFLFSKKSVLTKEEIESRELKNRKEWNIVASGPVKYDTFTVTTYDEYLEAFNNSKTEMFWSIPNHVAVKNDFKFDTYFTQDMIYERSVNHVFLNGEFYDGITLCTTHRQITKREFDYKFIANKKEINVLASTPVPYDIVFISYQEPTADENYDALKLKFPRAKRIHGVKGIHQAHIEAAKLCSTNMFWIVDGDAIIVDSFNFDYQVPAWEHDTVHVWRSKNPVNDLVYGYGGVKLFPTEMTINMDLSKPDMTTSISNKFKTVNVISNITSFNTDPFNTWKSAFRECCKLSSKIIDRQQDEETNKRLQTWTSIGKDRMYGNYAISGAKAGSVFGLKNKNNINELRKINDYEWLKEQFDNGNP